MADWRHRGFVPDSDEEAELDDDSQRQPRPNTQSRTVAELGSDRATTPLSSNGQTLPTRSSEVNTAQAQLDSELAHAQHARHGSATPSRERQSLLDLFSSSPLSEPPEDLSTPNTQQTAASQDDSQAEPSSFVGVVVPLALSAQQTVQAPAQLNHSLRKRNPIQLHPYMLESKQYRQSLMARGLKPLRIAQVREATVGADSQDQEFHVDDDTQAQESQLQHARPTSELSLAGDGTAGESLPVSSSLPSHIDDFDFPAVDTLLRIPVRDTAQHGFKRRKIAHTYGSKAPGQSLGNARSSSTARTPTRETNKAPSTFDIPESPSSSSGSDVQLVRRLPRATAAHPENPPSVARRRNITLDMDSESDAEPRSQPVATVVVSSDSSSSASDDEGDYAVQIRQVKRRMKGVLPASWLKLDLQKEASEKARQRLRVEKSRMQLDKPGVARPRHQHALARSRQSLSLSDLEDSEMSGQDEFQSEGRGPDDPGERRARSDDPSTSWPTVDDVQEDNRVDSMLPPVSRQARKLPMYSRKRHSRQPKITEKLHHGGPSRLRKPARSSKPHAPRLSILDAPTVRTTLGAPVPRFIRIAKRQARSRVERGRHSPSRKLLRLASRQDTADVENVLRDWREGTIVADDGMPRTVSDGQGGRPPLIDLPANGQPPHRAGSSSRTAPGKTPVGTTSVSMTTRPAVRQTTLRGLIEHRPPSDEAHLTAPLEPYHAPAAKERSGIIFPGQLGQSTARPAQLESTKSRYRTSRQRGGAFGDILSCVDRLYEQRRKLPQTKANIPLQRFLAEDESLPDFGTSDGLIEKPSALARTAAPARVKPRRLRRKRTPQQLDVDASEYRQTPQATLIIDDDDHSLADNGPVTPLTLRGLGPFGTVYTVSFDVTPLKTGTFFHQSTFIGSGNFAQAIDPGLKRDLSKPAGYATFQLENRILRWGPWSDETAFEIGSASDWITQLIQGIQDGARPEAVDLSATPVDVQLAPFFRFLIDYVRQRLSFPKPPDQLFFASTMLRFLQRVVGCASKKPEISLSSEQAQRALITTLAFALVVARQVLNLAESSDIATDLSMELERVLREIAACLVQGLIPGHLDKLRTSYEKNKRHVIREAGLREEDHVEQALVILNHVSRSVKVSIEAMICNSLISPEIAAGVDVQEFERAWQGLFALLPIQEIDQQGVLVTGRRFLWPSDKWAVPRGLASRLFAIYRTDSARQPPSFNAYCRAIFGRCHHLIEMWGWSRCEAMIGTLFDFFAANNLAHLRHEETWGSPRFLEELDKEQQLDIEPGERCFHIFLKIIGLGLRGMRQIYPEKKIRNIVFRLMPNHGRQYPREESVRQEDLESLRNHHDLLCTLHWASPPSCRPSLSIVRGLVHAETSHRQACHISIRTWANMVRFQLSTGEPDSALAPFADWHSEMTGQMLKQRTQARSEAQAQFTSATAVGGWSISRELLESTIENNQRQVEAVLSDVLVSMRLAIGSAKNSEDAAMLLGKGTICLTCSIQADPSSLDGRCL